MASQQQGTAAVSSGGVQRRTVQEMIQEVSQRIQNFGPGPITPEQAQELEKLKLIYAKLLKSQGEVIITHQQPIAGHAQVAMTTPTGTLPQGVTSQPSAVSRVVPIATTNQVQGSAPIQTTVAIITPGSGIATKIAVTSPTTLTTAQLQQIQAQALSQVQAHGQQSTGAINQQKLIAEHGKVATGQAILPTGQRILTSGSVTVATPTQVTTLKPVQNAGMKQVTQSSSPSIQLQRQLAPNKIQGGLITAAQVAGSVQNIAPSSSTGQKTLVSHAGIANRVETSSPQPQQVLTKRRLQELLHEIDPQEQMDDDVEDLLLQIADDFIESVVNASCQIAKHRKSNTLEVKDVQLHLERCWNMWIPGFGSDELRPYKKAATTEAHKQRMALIRKSLKK